MAKRHAYFFGEGKAQGSASMRNLLGGKGANLAEMSNLGIPVPPGFTITTEVCTDYYDNDGQYPKGLQQQVDKSLAKIEKIMGAKFGDEKNPLLISVRSGARMSMPGMMDTVLNIGLNDNTVQGLVVQTGNDRFAYDCYRRFIQMYSHVVLGMDSEVFENLIEERKKEKGVTLDSELPYEDMRDLVALFKDAAKKETGKEFPSDPRDQLWGAIGAVFQSWNGNRAITYRQIHNIPHHWGTATNVQAMVFGNMGDDCATGVAFTRDPATGDNKFYGEFLVNAQGEDVVAGIRTPQPMSNETKTDPSLTSLEELMPEIYGQLEDINHKLEEHYKEMQDIEFTVQRGKLWMLQTRTGKRTAAAAVQIAVDMHNEGLIDKQTAVSRVEPDQLDQLLHPTFDPKAERNVVAKGLPASPGAASGRVVFNAADAATEADKGEKVILVRLETSPEDIGGMNAAQGILTARGGMTSHAAVVARGMGKCCVVGCGAISIDDKNRAFTVDESVIKEGDFISLDGTAGEVILGDVPTIEPELSGSFEILMSWADEIRRLKVRTNADTPEDAALARKFGAEGIGLCRTEHMFFVGDRITAMREMILAEDSEGRRKYLAKLLPMQKGDFKKIFEAMEGLPVTIRLLDPPLHEFVPHEREAIEKLAQEMGTSVEAIEAKVESLREFNPMLGHRGCRLAISYPEISEMQARAIIEAACELVQEGRQVAPEIMIPLIGDVTELKILKDQVREVADQLMRDRGVQVDYLIGTMIETPRAALTADEVAREAEFFSYGTNDLTQMTYGFSRDDAGSFLATYVEQGILAADPFQTLDQTGVGQLVEMGAAKGRNENPNLKLGICGEHGGDPSSVEFFHRVGLDYVSCSPYRVPVARLAAAHAVIKEKVQFEKDV